MKSRLAIRANTLSGIHEFKDTVKQLSLETYDHRKFVRVERLKDWLIQDKGRIAELLGFAYHKSSTPALPIVPIQILRNPGALLVFSILLDLDLGHYIHQFCLSEILDNKLPAEKAAIREAFRKATTADQGTGAIVDQHTNRFYEKQFSYCPARFEYPHRREYNSQTILPILEKEIVSKKGATAIIWQFSVPEDFVAVELQEQLKLSKYNRDDEIGPRYHLAVKTFNQNKKEFFKAENEAFNALIDNSGMLKCFGHYEQPNSEGQQEHHLLLEYGQLDLDEYFMHNSRPMFPDQIADFWSRICDVVEAVAKLHEFKGPRKDINHTYYGWHADIKPDNILLVHGIFKLADPGFASFLRKQEADFKLQSRDQKIRVRGGTTTFGAPECHMGKFPEKGVSRNIDIWSLGCVLSLAATWVVLDKPGVLEYTEYRKHALRQFAPKGASLTVEPEIDLEHGDWFHDGKQVLEAVRQWHTYLRLIPRQTDFVTSKILDLVDESMLCPEQNRIGANELSVKMRELVSMHNAITTAKEYETSDNVPQLVQKYLAEQQRNAYSASPSNMNNSLSHVTMLEQDEVNPRKQKKSVLFQRSSLLHHPSATLRTSLISPLMSIQMDRNEQFGSLTSNPESIQIHVPDIPNQLTQTRTSSMSMQRTTTSNMSSDQSVLSSAELMQRQREKKRSRGFSRISTLFKKKDMDAILTQHFENRDIHFLVDNGSSMIDAWSDTKNLLTSLVKLAQGQDPDGPDLTFASGSEHLEKCQSVSKFESAMSRAAPDPNNQYKTDIRTSLQRIFDAYLKMLSFSKRKLVIIVLTDGLWEGMREPRNIYKTIVTFYRTMVAAVKLEDNKQVGIEFIHMGDDPAARERLKYLDDQLWKDEKIA